MSVQEISVPFPEEPSVFREVEDAVLDNQGNLLVYNRDTAVNYLSILNVANGTWEHHLVPSTGTGGNSTYGDMGRLGQRLFIPGYRIDLTNFSSTSFVLNQPPGGTGPFRVATTCTIGRDGLLYALSNVFPSHWLYVLDPETLATLQLFDLRNSAFQTLDVRGVDVNENGEIFGITNAGILYHFGADGRYLNESFVEPSFGGIDVALDDEMNLAVTGTSNRVAVTDESFAIPTTFFGEVRPHLVYVRAAGPACLDLDMDGYGDPANPECPHAAEDCDDQDDTVNPGETEGLTGDPTCLDGKDNDCDGLIDDLDPDCTTLIGLEAQLVADEPVFGAEYGFAVGATRDLAVVGAPEQDGNVGTAYVFARTDGVWSQEAQLSPSPGQPQDFFGISVAVTEELVTIGARGDNSFAGAAYVFGRSGESWAEQAKLVVDDPGFRGQLGFSIDVDADTLIAGARSDNELGSGSGSAYVFSRSEDLWSQEAKLLAPDGNSSDQFGRAVALQGDIAIVGAPSKEGVAFNSGAVYVFRRQEGEWAMVSKLTPEAPDRLFGFSVAIDGDTVVIGARCDCVEPGEGAVYLYRVTEGALTQEARFAAQPRTGASVAVDGDVVVAGSPGARLVYLSDPSGSAWTPLEVPGGDASVAFGGAVAVRGRTLIVGAPAASFSSPGSAFAFRLLGNEAPVALCRNVTVPAEAPCMAETSIDSGSFDPDGDPITLIQDPSGPYGLGGSLVTLTVTDDKGSSDSCLATVTVEDTTAPTGSVTFPPDGACFGTGITIGDDFTDACDAGLERVYDPGPGPAYAGHGDYLVHVEARDDSGNVVDDDASFSIDLVPPDVVSLVERNETLLVPKFLPIGLRFEASDDDGVAGGVVHEEVTLAGCLIYDGFEYGDGDGLLSDEKLELDWDDLCRFAEACEFDTLNHAALNFEAQDCAGNIGLNRWLVSTPILSVAVTFCRNFDVDLSIRDITDLVWADSADQAQSYTVYRGALANLHDNNYGSEFGTVQFHTIQDASTPEPGEGWFYLVEREGN